MNMSLHWVKGDYFAFLAKPLDSRKTCICLEMLINDLHSNKNATVAKFLCYCGSEDALWTIIQLLANANPRVSGNAAFILGTLAENEFGRERIADLSSGPSHECRHILPNLTRIFSMNDAESIMNAVGALGTLAESEKARAWLLGDPCINTTIKCVSDLLDNNNIWTASNAALLLARLTMSDEGCKKLLNHTHSVEIIHRLVNALGVDEAGRGLNAAFALGRLCDFDSGITRLLSLQTSEKMIGWLVIMLVSGNANASKNACFALSCIAANPSGHERLLTNSSCDAMIDGLAVMLTLDDHEAAWFAALTLKTLAKQTKSCQRLRDSNHVMSQLKAISLKQADIDSDLHTQVSETLDLLKPLEKPSAPVVHDIGTSEVKVEWQPVTTKSGLEVIYKVFEGSNCVYEGREHSCTVSNLCPFTTYSFCVGAFTGIDKITCSETTLITTQQSVPGPPQNVQVLAATATQLKVGWEPPDEVHGILHGYYVYVGKTLVEQTNELSAIISGLQPGTTYDISVCASTGKGKGEHELVTATTLKLGMHCPPKPEVSVRGRCELYVAWHPPPVPLGRITKYDLSMDGVVIYSGTDLYHVVHRLKPDTEYTFTVAVVSSEGRFESKSTRKRTAKDEFEPERTPLYQLTKRADAEYGTDAEEKNPCSSVELTIELLDSVSLHLPDAVPEQLPDKRMERRVSKRRVRCQSFRDSSLISHPKKAPSDYTQKTLCRDNQIEAKTCRLSRHKSDVMPNGSKVSESSPMCRRLRLSHSVNFHGDQRGFNKCPPVCTSPVNCSSNADGLACSVSQRASETPSSVSCKTSASRETSEEGNQRSLLMARPSSFTQQRLLSSSSLSSLSRHVLTFDEGALRNRGTGLPSKTLISSYMPKRLGSTESLTSQCFCESDKNTSSDRGFVVKYVSFPESQHGISPHHERGFRPWSRASGNFPVRSSITSRLSAHATRKSPDPAGSLRAVKNVDSQS